MGQPLWIRMGQWLGALLCSARLGAIPPAVHPPTPATPPPAALEFEIGWAGSLAASNATGRLFVILGPPDDPSEPRLRLGETGLGAAPFLARDATRFSAGQTLRLGRTQACFPQTSLDAVPPGEYRLQALFSTNRDLRLPNAPGGFISEPRRVRIDPRTPTTLRLELTARLPEESLPADTDQIRYVKLRSSLLTEFHGRPIFLRAAIGLPRSFATEPTRQYPLLVLIGGFGSRYTGLAAALAPGGHLAAARANGPEFLFLHLDGTGPWGDPYQVNSANNGPYGDAVVQELIPYVEQVCRGLGQPHARLLTGGSTGGWVSLALQLFYPDYFGGCWAGFPDSPDFRSFQLINLYQDANAFVNAHGFERAAARDLSGETRFTMRHEVQLENTLGAGDRFVASGGQWGAWAATFGPRGTDGAPVPPWDPRTGALNPEVAEAWKNYDLRHLLDQYRTNLVPRLQGKIHAWVGTADDYFLDGGLRRFALAATNGEPALEASIHFEPGVGHGWNPRPFAELLSEMQTHLEQRAPKTAAAARDALLRAKYGHGAACPHCRGGR